MRDAYRRTASLALAAFLLGACAAEESCARGSPSASCPDLHYSGVHYNEWREFDAPPPARMQELGDATYPDCNVPDGCPGSEFDGFAATDVWLIDDVDPTDAVIGIRQNSDTFVIFVAVGVEPEALPLPR